MQRHPPGPLEALVLDDAPRPTSSAWKGWLLAVGAFVLFVVCSGVGFWAIGRLTNAGMNRAGARGSLVYSWETPEEKSANVAAAMNGELPAAATAELRELTRFFGRVLDALREEDHGSFRDMVDHSAFAHRASLHPVAIRSGGIDRAALKDQLEYDLEGPRDWSRFSIVSVTRGSSREELLVYLVLLDDDQAHTPFRFWLRRSGRAWKVCDWEMLDLGYSEAARWALTRAIDGDLNSSQYWLASSAITRSYDDVQAGNPGAAQGQLREAEKKQLPAAVHDMTQIELASAWLYCSRPELALKACDRVRNPELRAAVTNIRARAAWDLERQAEFLDAAAKYRDLAGCHPELLQLEAEALESLGKRTEAADRWWEVLRLAPDDREALFEFCRLAEASRRADIKQVLERQRKPLDRAVEAGIEATHGDEIPAAEALLDYVRSAASNPAEAERLMAVQLEHDEQYLEAAQHYLTAHKLEDHPGRKSQSFFDYLSSMAAAKRAVEGYRAAQDPDAAFEFLTSGYEEDEAYISDEELPALLELHREKKPDNPRLDFLAGRLLLKQKKFAEAAEAFAKGEKNAGDIYLSDLLRAGRVEALYRQGDIETAYSAYPDSAAETFRELGWLASGDRDWQKLTKLIDLHRAREPSDPWINYFTAIGEREAKNIPAALAALQRAEAAGDESVKSYSAWFKTDLYLESDDVSLAYMTGGAPQDGYLRLAGRLADQEEWEDLLKLTQVHAPAGANDISSLYYATKARWHQEQYDQVASNQTKWQTEQMKSADQVWVAEVADLFVRSLLRQGRIEEARAAAELIKSEHAIELPLVAVELAAGNRDRVREMLDTPRLGRDVFERQLQHHRELAPLLTDSEFAGPRRRYALPRPNDFGQRAATIVLFLDRPVDSARLSEEFNRVVGPDAAQQTRSISQLVDDRQRTSLLSQIGEGTLVVTSESTAYCKEDEIPEDLADDSPLRQALAQHSAWLAIDLLRPDGPASSDEIEQLGQRLAAAFCDEQALALYTSTSRGNRRRLLLASAPAREQLAAGTLFRQADMEQAADVYLSESSQEVESAEPAAWPMRRKQLRELADQSRVEDPAGHAAIRVQLSRGHAREDLWLNVVRSERGDYRSEEFIGELTADSQLWPHLKTGERMRVAFYEPRAIRPIEK